MTATASSLSALHAAARDGDRVAMLTLGDLAEEQGDDGRAGAWRWLADPPEQGWERRAWAVCGLDRGQRILLGRGYGVGRSPAGLLVRVVSAGEVRLYRWRVEGGWRWSAAPEARDAILAACRQALSS